MLIALILVAVQQIHVQGPWLCPLLPRGASAPRAPNTREELLDATVLAHAARFSLCLFSSVGQLRLDSISVRCWE